MGVGGGLIVTSVICFTATGYSVQRGNWGGIMGSMNFSVFTLAVGIPCLVAGIPVIIIGNNKKNEAAMDYCHQQYAAFPDKPHF